MIERGRLSGSQSLPPIRSIIPGPETGAYDQFLQRGTGVPFPSAGVLHLNAVVIDQLGRAGQQRVRPMNSRRRSRLDSALLSTAPSTGFLSSRVTPEPSAIIAIQQPASFFLSDGESREHCRLHELDPSKTANLPRGSMERGSGPNFQLRNRSRRQKRVYRHRFFSDSIGQNEYHGVDAYVSRLTQIKLATQHLIRFAETYIPLHPGPLNVQEGVPIAEEVVNMLLYADFIGRALQEQRPSVICDDHRTGLELENYLAWLPKRPRVRHTSQHRKEYKLTPLAAH